MSDWYLAASLVALRTEINRRWPNRDKASDGALGDASHQARVSDHNPDYSAGGVVRAIDVDKDGIDVAELLAALTRDPRIEYVIWNRRMLRSYAKTIGGHTYKAWEWAPYGGPGLDPHTGHVHVSIKHARAAETNTSAWFKAAQPEEFDLSTTQYTTLTAQMTEVLNEVKACRRDVRDYALWEVLYDLETADERLVAEAAFDDARTAGKSITDAKVAAMKALQGLVDGVKASQDK
ncbi:MAG TPA: hypothetical protein VIQ11_21460 [Mycobacterium sp.]